MYSMVAKIYITLAMRGTQSSKGQRLLNWWGVPMGPNQPQVGQTRYQSTPLYMYIQNIKLVCIFGF